MLSVFDQGQATPCPQHFNMAEHVLAAGLRVAQKPALEVLGPGRADIWSHARLRAAILGTGTGLLECGLVPGARVLLRLGNTVDFPIAYLACIAVGLVPVPVSAQLTQTELGALIPALGPAAIVHDPSLPCPPCKVPWITRDQLSRMRDLPAADFAMGDPGRAAYIVYTSGTSGAARAVVHAHRAVWARRMMHDGWAGLRASDRLLHAGAFNWTYTMGTGLMDPWSVAATALIPEPGFDPAHLPMLLAQSNATIFAAVPGVYRKILTQNIDINLPALRHGLSAGEKLSAGIAQDWTRASGTAIYEAFGMSECSTFISSSPTAPAPITTLGRPQPGRRVAIMGDAGPLDLGQTGIIAVHRDDPGLMLGYLNAPDESAARLQGDWFLTGDLGVMQDDHTITYHGRADDMMNAGGFRVSPLEVERALADLPGVTQIAVTDIEVKPDTRVIMAFYTAPAPLPEADLLTLAATRLARYKCPRRFVHLSTLPVSANGKLQRRALASVAALIEGS